MVAAAGVVLFAKFAWDRSQFGISERAPLGDFRKLDPFLAYDEGLRKSEGVPEGFDATQVTEVARVYTYTDAVHATPSEPQRIVVFLRADGAIAAIGAQTSPGPEITQISRVMWDEWKRIFGGKPSSSGWHDEHAHVVGSWEAKDGQAVVLIRAR